MPKEVSVVGNRETVDDLTPGQMTQTLLSFAHSKIAPPAAMLNTLYKRIMAKMHEFKPREIVRPRPSAFRTGPPPLETAGAVQCPEGVQPKTAV